MTTPLDRSTSLHDIAPQHTSQPINNYIPNSYGSRENRPSAQRAKYLKATPHDDVLPQNYQEGMVNDDPFADLDYLVTQIVRCDEQFCETLPDMHMDTMLISIHIKYPEIQHDLDTCIAEHGPGAKPCMALFTEAVNRVNPMVYDLIEQKRRAISPDPLVNYDGLQYMSPFWFEGSGDIWRRVDGRSKRVSIADCHRVQRRLDDCLALPENQRTTNCFKEYAHVQMCVPGTHCPYLRFPMTQCMFSELITDYRGLDHCFSTIPRFQRCQEGFVSLDSAL